MAETGIREALAKIFHWRGRTFALFCLFGFLIFRIVEPVPFEHLRAQLFDALHIMEPRDRQELPVIIVDIDERSLAKYGQWPWPRNLMARLVDRVAETNPLSIGFDILFAEPDRYSPDRVLSHHDGIHPEFKHHLENLPSNDQILAKSLSQTRTVLGVGVLLTTEKTEATRPVSAVPMVERGGNAKASLLRFPTAIQSLEVLDTAATSRATLNAIPDFDGVIRRIPLVLDVGGTVTPTLTLEMLRIAVGAPFFALHSDKQGIRGVQIADVFVPTEPDGRIWINYSLPSANLYVSAADVLDGTINPAILTQKLVLLGSTGLGLTDTKATPVAPQMNGIEVHAHILESIITDDHLIRPVYADWLELGLAAGTGLFLIIVVPLLGSRWSTTPLIFLLGILGVVAWFAHAEFSLRIDTSFAGATNTAVFAILLIASFIETDRLRHLLQQDLDAEREAAQRMEGELSAARSIQLGILPSDFPAYPEHPEFDLFATLEPAKAVGGDLYDFAMLDEHHLFFIIGDVSGKGIPASLFMALTKAVYKSSAMRRQIEIDKIMTESNAEISRENPAMMFVTALSGILDIRTGLIQFCNAGHDPPLLLSPGKDVESITTAGGPPLCVLDDFDYPSGSYQLAPGDMLVMFTDGVTEALNPAQELYSNDRLEALLQTVSRDSDSETVAMEIYSDVTTFADGAEASDDVTIMVLRYLGPNAA